MKKINSTFEVFRIFQNAESFFQDRSKEQSRVLIFKQVLVIALFTFVYGLVMGSYHSVAQSIASGLKMVLLFLGAFIICFPSFFVIQQVLGSKMTLRQMLLIVLSGLVLTSSLVLSFSPIVVFFQITGGNYHFLQLLHVAVFVFAGVFGMRLMVDALKFACETQNVYPQIGVTVFRVWVVILAFVGVQLAWNLRPFLSDKGDEFKLFRDYEGNFYTAIIYSVQKLVEKDEVSTTESKKSVYLYVDTANVERHDTSEISKLLSK